MEKNNKDEEQQDYINKVNDARVKLGNDYLSNAITKDEYESQMISLESTIADQIFEEQVSSAMMNTFLKNIAILAGPNYIQAKLIYGKNGASKLLDNINTLTKELESIPLYYIYSQKEEELNNNLLLIKEGLSSSFHDIVKEL